MERTPILRIALAALVASAFAVACQTTGTTEEDMTRGGESFGGNDGSLSDRGMIEGTDIPAPTPELSVVYFDFDKSEIRADQRSKLQRNAEIIREHDWGSVTIAGHCDERGSEEYNLALGERRANSVRQYLTSLGVSSSALGTVSFGESQPAVQGHDESAWRYNRRTEFSVR